MLKICTVLVDPDLDDNPKRRRTDKGNNAKFDQMIETMSIMYSHIPSTASNLKRHKKRRSQSLNQINDAYIKPPLHSKHRLSFVKMSKPASFTLPNESQPSSDSNEAKSIICNCLYAKRILHRLAMPQPQAVRVAMLFQSGWQILSCLSPRHIHCVFCFHRT